MEGFLDFLQTVLFIYCLAALIYYIIRFCVLCFNDLKEGKQYEKQDCLAIYEQDYAPLYVPLCKIDNFVFDNAKKAIEINMKDGEEKTIAGYSRFEIKKVETKYIKQL